MKQFLELLIVVLHNKPKVKFLRYIAFEKYHYNTPILQILKNYILQDLEHHTEVKRKAKYTYNKLKELKDYKEAESYIPKEDKENFDRFLKDMIVVIHNNKLI